MGWLETSTPAAADAAHAHAGAATARSPDPAPPSAGWPHSSAHTRPAHHRCAPADAPVSSRRPRSTSTQRRPATTTEQRVFVCETQEGSQLLHRPHRHRRPLSSVSAGRLPPSRPHHRMHSAVRPARGWRRSGPRAPHGSRTRSNVDALIGSPYGFRRRPSATNMRVTSRRDNSARVKCVLHGEGSVDIPCLVAQPVLGPAKRISGCLATRDLTVETQVVAHPCRTQYAWGACEDETTGSSHGTGPFP